MKAYTLISDDELEELDMTLEDFDETEVPLIIPLPLDSVLRRNSDILLVNLSGGVAMTTKFDSMDLQFHLGDAKIFEPDIDEFYEKTKKAFIEAVFNEDR